MQEYARKKRNKMIIVNGILKVLGAYGLLVFIGLIVALPIAAIVEITKDK